MSTNTTVKRSFVGEVVSTAMAKTIVVRVDGFKIHPRYHKQYRTSRRYQVHDENGTAKVGDKVTFVECRPLSRHKRWRLEEKSK